MPTNAEQIAAYEAKRGAIVAGMQRLTDAAGDNGATFDEAQQKEFASFREDLKGVDGYLDSLRVLEKALASTAKPVEPKADKQQAWNPASPFAVVKRTPDVDPSFHFARYAKLKAIAKHDNRDIIGLCERAYPDDTVLLEMFTKAAVAAGTTSDATWASPLVNPLGFAAFLEYLRPRTILGQFGTGGIPALQRIPFRVPIVTQSTGGAAYWVGEGKAKPLTKFDFTRTTLDPLKVANIAVLTMELVRDSSPAADERVRNQLAAAIIQRLDNDFIDPTKTAVAGVSPASITNGVTPIPSSGTDADAVRADIKALVGEFVAANNPLMSGVLVMPATLALALGLMVNPLGQPEFNGVSRTGGTLLGLPIIVSESVPATTVVLLNASDILLGDEGGIDVSMSDQASLQMDDAPTNASAPVAATSLVSLWQTNSVGFRAERTINWARGRTQSVSLLSGVDWGATA